MTMRLLIVYHTQSGTTSRMADAVIAGAKSDEVSNVEVRVKSAIEADADDLIWADGFILGTPENFGYMSGAVKDFLERVYYPCLELTEGKPAAVFIKGGLDGQGAKTSVERILVGLKWKLIQPTLVMKGEFQPQFLDQCEELGLTMAAGLEAGIY